jgi:ribosomal protein S12 methylthiotransferase
MADCVAEARWLAGEGVKELIVVAQDPTAYGEDWGKPGSICELLDKLNKVPGLEWIRIMYAYPERITDEFIAAMKRNEKVVPYLDLPIQHCNDTILKNMNRRSTRAELLEVIGKLRREIPGITLRTTLIAGFPGETEEQFEDLCNFVKEVQFDRLGCFAYSAEENTVAARMPNQIEDEVKQRVMTVAGGVRGLLGQRKAVFALRDSLITHVEGFALLAQVWPLLAPGGVIVIDDCHADHAFDGAHQAWREFIAANGLPAEIVEHKLAVLRKP